MDKINKKNITTLIIHAILFVLTFFTTTLAGVQWLNKDPLELSNFFSGLPYGLSILFVLLAHEMGHYFAARSHGIATSLPYFIPAPPFIVNPFGTLGALIRIRTGWSTKKSLFDIGIAGPIFGLLATLIILVYGFLTLPSKEYIFTIHPEYRAFNDIPAYGFTFGNSLLFQALSFLFSNNNFIPPMNEIYHYPYLCVGWFGLFVTALNLLPVGQLDGGHILYALMGKKKHSVIARIFFSLLLITGVLSIIPLIFYKLYLGSLGWILWALILYFVVKLDHPDVQGGQELTMNRRILGWIILGIFILTFPPVPFIDIPQ